MAEATKKTPKQQLTTAEFAERINKKTNKVNGLRQPSSYSQRKKR
jgi:hypothetical protein